MWSLIILEHLMDYSVHSFNAPISSPLWKHPFSDLNWPRSSWLFSSNFKHLETFVTEYLCFVFLFKTQLNSMQTSFFCCLALDFRALFLKPPNVVVPLLFANIFWLFLFFFEGSCVLKFHGCSDILSSKCHNLLSHFLPMPPLRGSFLNPYWSLGGGKGVTVSAV